MSLKYLCENCGTQMDNLQAFRDGDEVPLTFSCPLCGYNNGKGIRRAQLEGIMRKHEVEGKSID
jgi:predicted nucleic acid-binding Zn ribbon protein